MTGSRSEFLLPLLPCRTGYALGFIGWALLPWAAFGCVLSQQWEKKLRHPPKTFMHHRKGRCTHLPSRHTVPFPTPPCPHPVQQSTTLEKKRKKKHGLTLVLAHILEEMIEPKISKSSTW